MEWGECYLIAHCTIPELNMYIHTEMVLNTHTLTVLGVEMGGCGVGQDTAYISPMHTHHTNTHTHKFQG